MSEASDNIKTADTHVDASKDTEERPNIDKSGLYDLQQIKRLIDDEVISFMESQGYIESTATSNVKLVAGTIAVIAAVYSHFGVGEFPACRPIVLACVVTYIVCSVLITLASLFFEASAMFVGRLTRRARLRSKELPPRVWVHTTLGGKGTSTLHVHIRKSVHGKNDASDDSHGYERYFTTEGHFLRDIFTADMKSTLSRTLNAKKKQ